MSFYIIMWNFTEQGIKNVKESPKRADAFKSLLEKNGGKLHRTFYTFGKYDGVSIVEAANDESIMSTLLSIESEGNARTITLKAFTYEEGTKIINNL
ncbi:MAG TPA: GYD domain-containing protein [Nitrososphaeraceae archaeon]